MGHMRTQTGFRFRCYPTPAQARILLRRIGCQRFIYNAKVTEPVLPDVRREGVGFA